jgi:hypothetical protein
MHGRDRSELTLVSRVSGKGGYSVCGRELAVTLGEYHWQVLGATSLRLAGCMQLLPRLAVARAACHRVGVPRALAESARARQRGVSRHGGSTRLQGILVPVCGAATAAEALRSNWERR